MANTAILDTSNATEIDKDLNHKDAQSLINEAVLRPYVEKIVYSTLKDILHSNTPDNQIALLLYTQVRDTEAFKLELNARLTRLEQDMSVLKEDVAVLKEDMAFVKSNLVTKNYWEEEKLRLLQGINKEMRIVIHEYFDKPLTSEK